MRILLLTPFLLGNSAGGAGAAIEGLLALFIVIGAFALLWWGAVQLWKRR